MRTIDDLRRTEDRTPAERAYIVAYYHRLCGLTHSMPRHEPRALMSRAVQVSKTWRMHFAWQLVNALGWR